MAKIETAKDVTKSIQEAIHEIVKNPKGGAPGHTQEQTLQTLTSELKDLLDAIKPKNQPD